MSYPQAIYNNVADTLSDTASGVTSYVGDTYANTISDFSSPSEIPYAGLDFLVSNSIVAKFVFLILVLVGFMFTATIGIYLIQYLGSPSKDPYIIYGLIDGNQAITVPQNPKMSNSVTILRSNDQALGLEASWSTWLYLTANASTSTTPTYSHIFNKGNSVFNSTTGIATVNNGPGLYVTNAGIGAVSLEVIVDCVSGPPNIITVSDVPFNIWFNIIIRYENSKIDIYINGTASNSVISLNTIDQNYADINVCQNGGFNGKLSNLQYFSRALTAFEINNLVYKGANLTQSPLSSLSSTISDSSYLSSYWYNSMQT